MHYYTCDVDTLATAVVGIAKSLPPQWANQLVLGETGCALASATCTTGHSPADRVTFLQGVASSAALQSVTHAVLLWRTTALSDPAQGCEGTFGVTQADDGSYDAAGAAASACASSPPLPSWRVCAAL